MKHLLYIFNVSSVHTFICQLKWRNTIKCKKKKKTIIFFLNSLEKYSNLHIV